MNCISVLCILSNVWMIASWSMLNFVVDAPSTLYHNADSDISVALLLQAIINSFHNSLDNINVYLNMNWSMRFLFLVNTREWYFFLSCWPQYHNTASAPTSSMRASIPPAVAPPSLVLPSPFELAEYTNETFGVQAYMQCNWRLFWLRIATL